MKNIILAFVVASFFGCTTVPTYDQYLRSWEGRPLEHLVHEWGDSTHEVTLKSGEKLLVYVRKEKNEVACRTSFLVNKFEKIISWKFEGGKCQAP